MITWKHICWISIALFHLVVVAMHAAHMKEWNRHPAWLSGYGDFTGSGNIFSFFAPAIGNEIAVLYTVADGRSQKVIRLEGQNTEANRRIQTIYNFFSIEEAQPLLARSCAAYVLRGCKDGTMVRVTVVSKQVPVMKAYREGVVPKWAPFLVKDYRKNSQ
jgi:hypothetical protein